LVAVLGFSVLAETNTPTSFPATLVLTSAPDDTTPEAWGKDPEKVVCFAAAKSGRKGATRDHVPRHACPIVWYCIAVASHDKSRDTIKEFLREQKLLPVTNK
jgi:hypothetical protein